MQSPAGIKQLERSFRRLRLLVCGCIYEVTTPRYARFCFDAHVETRSAPDSLCFVLSHRGEGGVGEFKFAKSTPTRTVFLRQTIQHQRLRYWAAGAAPKRVMLPEPATEWVTAASP